MITTEERGKSIVFNCPPGFGDPVEGEALVTRDGFSARYDLDPLTGIISRESHDLYGQSIANKIVIFDFAKGGVATSWRLLDLVERGTAPAGLVFNVINPVMVQAAVLANISIVHRLEPNPLVELKSGDWVRIFPKEGRVEAYAEKPESALQPA